MKKMVLFFIVMSCFLSGITYAQTSLDLIDKVNEKTYESLMEDDKFSAYEAEIRTKMQETKQSFLDALKEYEDVREHSRDVIQDKVYIESLEQRASELKWKNRFLENEVDSLEKENQELKRNYALIGKFLYYAMEYPDYTAEDFKQVFSDKEIEKISELYEELKNIYD